MREIASILGIPYHIVNNDFREIRKNGQIIQDNYYRSIETRRQKVLKLNFEGMDMSKIADTLGLPYSVVSNDLVKAREHGHETQDNYRNPLTFGWY